MKKYLLLLLMIVNPFLLSQKSSSISEDSLLVLLNKEDIRSKTTAIMYIESHPENKENKNLQDKLIQILILDKEYIKKRPIKSEAEAEYIYGLLDLVSDFHRQETFDLIAATGDLASIVKFGDKGIKIVLDKVIDKNDLIAIKLLEKEVAKNKVQDKKLLTQIKNVFLESLQYDDRTKHPERDSFKSDEKFLGVAYRNAVARKSIIQVLSNFNDQDVVSVLKKYIKSDPYKMTNKKDGKEIYPVREAAKISLNKIKQNSEYDKFD
jgi:hypothetical protein